MFEYYNIFIIICVSFQIYKYERFSPKITIKKNFFNLKTICIYTIIIDFLVKSYYHNQCDIKQKIHIYKNVLRLVKYIHSSSKSCVTTLITGIFPDLI